MDIFATINQYLGGPIGSIIGALVIFILGWFFASIIAGVVRKLLSTGNVNQHMNSSTGQSLDLENIGARIVFWFVFAMAVAGALSMLNINAISEPFAKMISQVLSFLPTFFGAAIVGVVGWILATIARTGLSKALASTTLDEKLSEDAGMEPMSDTLADIVYWVILLFVLTMVLGKLGLHGLFEPLTNMINKTMSYIPNIFMASVVFFVGLIAAKIVRGITTNIVSAMNIQEFAEKAGISKDSENSLPNLAGSLAFLVVIIPVTITALHALKIEVISRPATNMLNKIMEAIPNVITAAAILIVTYYVMRMVTNVVKGVLENTQINALPARIGVQEALGESKVSDLVAAVIMFFAMLFALIMATDLLGFTPVSDIIQQFIQFGGSVLQGSVILLVGFWLANFVSGVVERSEQGSPFLANIVRVLIIGLVLAMGLNAMGIADSIVNLAFGLTLGAVAVAFALSFGLGGQEAAGRFLRTMQDKCDACNADDTKQEEVSTTPPVTPQPTTDSTFDTDDL